MRKVISLSGYRRDRQRVAKAAYNDRQYEELKSLLETATRLRRRRRRFVISWP